MSICPFAFTDYNNSGDLEPIPVVVGQNARCTLNRSPDGKLVEPNTINTVHTTSLTFRDFCYFLLKSYACPFVFPTEAMITKGMRGYQCNPFFFSPRFQTNIKDTSDILPHTCKMFIMCGCI